MALFDTTWYVSSVGYTAVASWVAATVTAAGTFVRATAPAVGAERVFVCIVAGTTHATTQPTWTNTRGAKTTDNTVTWQECTGASAVNGDLTNTPNWTSVKNTAITLGAIIKRDNAASYQICSTAGTAGNGAEPAFSDTAGTTTADNTVTWTSLGVVGNFTGGQAPGARIDHIMLSTWAALSNFIYVKSDHAQTAAAQVNFNYGASGSQAQPLRVFCHDGTVYPPTAATLTTGAVCSSTGANTMQFGVTGGAGVHYRGIAFECGSGNNSLNFALLGGITPAWLTFDNCALRMTTTSTTSRLHIGQSGYGVRVKFINGTTVKFGAVGQAISTLSGSGVLDWQGGGLEAGSSAPTILFTPVQTAAAQMRIRCEGVDLSAVTSKLVQGVAVTASVLEFKDCKLASGVVAFDLAGSTGAGVVGPLVKLIRCDDADTSYRVEQHNYLASETTEITIVRSGGATDGTTAQARKIVTSANAIPLNPYEALPITIWNETVGSALTLTLYGIWGGGAVPNNNDFWMDVEYLGTSGVPRGSVISSGLATPLTAATGLSSDSSSWGGSTTAFTTSVTFTPQEKGPVTVYVKAGKASSTFYYDPKLAVTGIVSGKTYAMSPGVFVNAGGGGGVGVFSGAYIG